MPIAGPGDHRKRRYGHAKCSECGVVVAQFTDARMLSGILEYIDALLALLKDNRYRKAQGRDLSLRWPKLSKPVVKPGPGIGVPTVCPNRRDWRGCAPL